MINYPDASDILYVVSRRFADPDNWRKGPAFGDEAVYMPCNLRNAVWRASNALGLKATLGEVNTALKEAEGCILSALKYVFLTDVYAESFTSINQWEDQEWVDHHYLMVVLDKAHSLAKERMKQK